MFVEGVKLLSSGGQYYRWLFFMLCSPSLRIPKTLLPIKLSAVERNVMQRSTILPANEKILYASNKRYMNTAPKRRTDG